MADAATKKSNSMYNQVKLIVIGLIIGTFSIFAASSFRDFMDSILQIATPIGERSLAGGAILVAYRFCYFLIILAILVAVSVLFI